MIGSYDENYIYIYDILTGLEITHFATEIDNILDVSYNSGSELHIAITNNTEILIYDINGKLINKCFVKDLYLKTNSLDQISENNSINLQIDNDFFISI